VLLDDAAATLVRIWIVSSSPFGATSAPEFDLIRRELIVDCFGGRARAKRLALPSP